MILPGGVTRKRGPATGRLFVVASAGQRNQMTGAGAGKLHEGI